MITEDQKKKYEEAAKRIFDAVGRPDDGNEMRAFIAGTEHAHPEGYKVGYRDGHDSGWNEAMDAAIARLKISKAYLLSEQVNELQKLRK